MRLPHKTLERKLFNSGYRYIIGIDEVGVGPLAGPVVVCAVLFTKKFFQKKHKHLTWLRDSKLLLPHQREKFAEELLKTKSIRFKLSYCFPKTIDRINIYQAARLAMRRAVKKVLSMKYKVSSIKKNSKIPNTKYFIQNTQKIIALVDGKNRINKLNLDQMPIVKGDRKIFSIACASILAKVFRDRTMKRYAKKFPRYGFEKHKGYGTKQHRVRLVSLGPCEIHRKSFAPVAKLI